MSRETAKLLALAGAELVVSQDASGSQRWILGDIFCCAQRQGQHVSSLTVDGAGPPVAEELAREVLERLGGLDLIILDATDSAAASGNFVPRARAFLPYLRRTGKGHLSFVSRLEAFLRMPDSPAAGAGEASPAGFARSLRGEIGAAGPEVSVLLAPDRSSSQLVARRYLREILSGSFHIVPGTRARLLYSLRRRFPLAFRWWYGLERGASFSSLS